MRITVTKVLALNCATAYLRMLEKTWKSSVSQPATLHIRSFPVGLVDELEQLTSELIADLEVGKETPVNKGT